MKIDFELLNEHYADPYHHGVCDGATHCGEAVDSHGDCAIGLSMAVTDDGEVEEAWFDGAGCEVCEGYASLLCEQVEGEVIEDLLRADYRQQWIARFAEAGLSKNSCLQLPLNALLAALKPEHSALDEPGQIDFGGPSLREEQ